MLPTNTTSMPAEGKIKTDKAKAGQIAQTASGSALASLLFLSPIVSFYASIGSTGWFLSMGAATCLLAVLDILFSNPVKGD